MVALATHHSYTCPHSDFKPKRDSRAYRNGNLKSSSDNFEANVCLESFARCFTSFCCASMLVSVLVYPILLMYLSTARKERITSLEPIGPKHRVGNSRAPRQVQCDFHEMEKSFFESSEQSKVSSPVRYIVINEPRSGSSWLQEMSNQHPAIRVQFELDINFGASALQCKRCLRKNVPDSKDWKHHPIKIHPPMACGMTIFGGPNGFEEVGSLAQNFNASLIIILRRNYVAQAISSYLNFAGQDLGGVEGVGEAQVPWYSDQLVQKAREMKLGYEKLLQFPDRTGRPSHLIYYEDFKARPAEVWTGFLRFLGLPDASAFGVTLPASLQGLERPRARRAPSSHHLWDREGILRELAGTEWGDMLDDEPSSPGGGFDSRVDFGDEFARACARFPRARMSWRGHECAGGRAVEVDRNASTVPDMNLTMFSRFYSVR